MAPYSINSNPQSFNISSVHALRAIRRDYIYLINLNDVEEYYENNDFQEDETTILSDILKYYGFEQLILSRYWNIVKLTLMHAYVIHEADCLFKLLKLVKKYNLCAMLRDDYDFPDEEFTNTENTELHNMIFNKCNGNYAYIIAITNNRETRSFYRKKYEIKNNRMRPRDNYL